MAVGGRSTKNHAKDKIVCVLQRGKKRKRERNELMTAFFPNKERMNHLEIL